MVFANIIKLKFLFNAEGLSLGTRFSLKGSLHRIHSTLMVFASIIKLFNLLLDFAINFLAHLSKLKLSSENFVLLLFKSSFSFLKGSLELLFLNFKATPLFVKFMDGATTIAKLVKKILDLIS